MKRRAYQYAFVRTLRTTSETTVGPQHPAYDYHLAGRGDLVLTQLQQPSAVLDLPASFDRLLLVSTPREQVLAELGPRSAQRIAVPSGTYKLRAWRGAQAFGARVTLAQGQELRLEASELIPMHSGSAVAKGDVDFESVISVTAVPASDGQPKPWSIAVELGVLDGAAKDAVLGGGRLGLERRFGAKRLAATISAGTGRAPGMRENRVTAEMLPSWWLGTGRFSAGLGLGFGAGTGIERLDGSGHIQWSGLVFASPTALVEVGLGHRLSLHASAELPLTLLRRDDRVTATALSATWLGLARGF